LTFINNASVSAGAELIKPLVRNKAQNALKSGRRLSGLNPQPRP